MKVILVIMFGFLLGGLSTFLYSSFNKEYVVVTILDKSECTPVQYSIVESNSKTIVSGGLIETENTSIVIGSEAVIRFIPEYNGKDLHSYKVMARYSDCEDLVSEEREVKRGRFIYEWIENRKVKHQVRA